MSDKPKKLSEPRTVRSEEDLTSITSSQRSGTFRRSLEHRDSLEIFRHSIPNKRDETKKEDEDGYHSPEGGEGIVVIGKPEDLQHPALTPLTTTSAEESSKRRNTPPPPARKTSLLLYSDDEETKPLLNHQQNDISGGEESYNHTRAYELLKKLPTLDRSANQFDNERDWFCLCRKQSHPMASAFTNKTFRQDFIAKIIKLKAIQIGLCFLASILSQISWSWAINEIGTPFFVLIIEENRWIVVVALTLYWGLIYFIRFSHRYGRTPPLNIIFFIILTLLICFKGYAGSVGFADTIHSGIIPVAVLSLFISYIGIYLLIIPKEQWPLRVDVNSNKFYIALIPIIPVSVGISWPFVYWILHLADSVVHNRNPLESFIWEGLLTPPIIAIILIIEVYHIRDILNGKRVSIITEDKSEAMFASFYV